MQYHEDLLQQPPKWPYELILDSFKPGILVTYRKERIVQPKLPDGTFKRSKGRGLMMPKGQIALVIKGPYIHECGRLICMQILHGKQLYEDRYLSPKSLIKHVRPTVNKIMHEQSNTQTLGNL